MYTEIKKEETWEERQERETKEFRELYLVKFFELMKSLNIEYFTVDFNGAGDDGMVEDPLFVKDSDIPSWSDIRKEVGLTDDITYDSDEHTKLTKKATALHRHYCDPDNINNSPVYTKLPYDKQGRRYTVSEYINEFVCMYMSAKNIDWYNNEGGSGTFTYNDGQLQIEGQTFYQSEDPFDFEEFDSEVKNG